MARYRHEVFVKASTPRYVVVYDLQWKVIECRRLEPGSDLSAAMAATLVDLQRSGWQPETELRFGFVFLRRGVERVLVTITEREPGQATAQSFSPFRDAN
jgi:hypothetical protein